MTGDESITHWMSDLRRGNDAAAEKLWSAYFERMVEIAGRQLAASDREDAALSAFKSFCLGLKKGKFPELRDRDNLWPLLIALTRNKSVDAIRQRTRAKRGGQMTAESLDLTTLLSDEPTPEFLTEFGELLNDLLDRLDRTGDPNLRLIALRKLDGESTEEIAERLQCARRTVERKMQVIEQVWIRSQAESGDDP